MLDVLLILAAELSGYPLPAHAPTLAYRPAPWLRAQVCAGTTPCNVHGLYLDHGDVIYLDQRLQGSTSAIARSVVLHELVHYLQDRAGQHDGSCAQRQAREREAYGLQQRYLQQQGLVTQLRIPVLPCEAVTATVSAVEYHDAPRE